MKKCLSILFLGFIAIATLFAVPVQPVRTMQVPMATVPPAMDGIKEASYSALQETSCIYPDQSYYYWDGPADFTAQFALCWDADFLYVYTEIQDDIEHDYTPDIGDPWAFDNFFIYMQLDTQTVPSLYDVTADHFLVTRGLDSMCWSGTKRRTVASEYGYYQEAQAPGGWITEIAIPWTSLQAEGSLHENIMDYIGTPIGFDFQGGDSDGSSDTGARDFQTAWDLDGQDGTEDLAWNNTSVFGYIELLNTGVSIPTANAGPDQTVGEGELVTLDGSGSSDPDADPLTYTWTPPAAITLSDIHAINPTFIAPAATQTSYYTFGLSVNNGETTSSIDFVRITVEHTNQAPIADAGPDQTVMEHELVMLDGSRSSDLESSVTSYSWETLESLNLIHPSTPNPLLVAPDVATDSSFRFVLTVSDGSQFSEPDTMNLWVRSAFDEYDTLLIYDTVYMVDVVYNTVLITAVNEEYEITAHEIDGVLHLDLFPNPADQFINVSSEMLIEKVQILNAQGALVVEEIVDDNAAQINVGSMAAGNYILQITCETGIITKQMVLE